MPTNHETPAPNTRVTDADGPRRGARPTAEMQRRLATSMLAAVDGGPEPLRRLRDEWSRYTRRVAGLTLDYYRGLADAVRDYGAEVAPPDRVREPPETGSATTEGAGAPEHPHLELRGRSGSVLVTSFALENQDPVPAEVAVAAGAARGTQGAPFVAPLSIEPAVVTIPPGGTQRIELRVALLPDVFAPGAPYRLPLQVTGPRPATIDVSIVAEADAEPAHDPAGETHRLRCPACGRIFERRTADPRLRPHKHPDGSDCPTRDGQRIA